MVNLKLHILIILLCMPIILFSQEKTLDSIFQLEIKNIISEFPDQIDFKKTHSFYLEKQWDSTLVYSMKQLSFNPSKKLSNYSC